MRGCLTRIASLLRGFERFMLGGIASCGLDLGGFLLAKLDDVFDQIAIVDAIAGLAVKIDLAMAFAGAAAGESRDRFRAPRPAH